MWSLSGSHTNANTHETESRRTVNVSPHYLLINWIDCGLCVCVPAATNCQRNTGRLTYNHSIAVTEFGVIESCLSIYQGKISISLYLYHILLWCMDCILVSISIIFYFSTVFWHGHPQPPITYLVSNSLSNHMNEQFVGKQSQPSCDIWVLLL